MEFRLRIVVSLSGPALRDPRVFAQTRHAVTCSLHRPMYVIDAMHAQRKTITAYVCLYVQFTYYSTKTAPLGSAPNYREVTVPTKFQKNLNDLLTTNEQFTTPEGHLFVTNVIDRAWKIDHDLLKLLLSDADIKAKFFDEIDGHWMFNVNTFVDFISNKDFLDNSYTRFRNNIGLTIGDKYLQERGEVSLVWPYKDCVLEGGQTHDEESREEVFLNELLAPDEINRLLDPKVLTGWNRYTVDGDQEVDDLRGAEDGTISENLLIKGNNLLALHTLKSHFRRTVKLIYIDPPYNTGNDSFGYNDRFNHSSWLTFMNNRLEVAKEFLRDDGSIFVNCDDNEQAYL